MGVETTESTGSEPKPTKGTLLWGSKMSAVPSVLAHLVKREPVMWVMPAEPQSLFLSLHLPPRLHSDPFRNHLLNDKGCHHLSASEGL